MRYVGEVNRSNVQALLDLVEGELVTELVISSGGGEVNAGMLMGDWVFDNQIDVVVEGICMSSAANYVFPAGRKKTIREQSIVGWHGNVLQFEDITDEEIRVATIQGYEELSEEDRAEINLEERIQANILGTRIYHAESKERQAQFFDKIGVDEYVCRIGNVEYGVNGFFLLGVEDMERFGIQNVSAPANYEEIDLTPFLERGWKIEFIHLSNNTID